MSDIISKSKKIALGLSGGVDSSVAAYLLREQGYEVTGVYMQCWDIKSDGCAADEDKAYALQSAAKLGIKFVHLDLKERYKSTVIEYFYKEYQEGRTPNPDVMCNKEIKFGIFYDWAMENGYDYIATGHYARVVNKNDSYSLLKGVDLTKDQSYFLYLLDQKKLQKTLLPIGDLNKSDVRKIAKEIGLPTAERPDSMGICFIGEVDIKDFLKKRLTEKKGMVLDKLGNIVGTHEGAWFYTIGQRHGFTVNKYSGKAMYIINKDTIKNELVVGFESDVFTDTFTFINPHWINEVPNFDKNPKFTTQVRIRHLGNIVDCVLSTESKDVVIVKTTSKVFGVAPGQSAVIYQGDVVLGGGIIDQVSYL